MSNLQTWETLDVVDAYRRADVLQSPEEYLLDMLRDVLKNMAMLDIGVGAGRTALHFAGLAREYVGIDYSAKMIEACQERFGDTAGRITFKVCDARSLTEFENDYFDLVLFSFNGLDYLSYDGRMQALEQIRRVGKKGGLFCFSTHNTQAIYQLYHIRLTLKPIRLLRELRRYARIRKHNGPLSRIRRSTHAIINDGAHHFRLSTFYIAPSEQLKQLQTLGFSEVQMISISSGQRIDTADLASVTDPWIYYLCRI